MWKGVNCSFGSTGRTTALSSRNFVNVKMSSGAMRRVKPSNASFICSSSMVATLMVVAIHKYR